MELIAAIVIAGPLGYYCRAPKQGRLFYLLLWVTIFPIQTIVVYSTSSDGHDVLYWIFNLIILGLGLGLNAAGAWLRERRLRTATP